MKILFIVQNIIGHGTYLRAYELAKALKNLGHSVTLLASSREIRKSPTTTEIGGFKIIGVSNYISGPTQAGWDLYNLFSRKKVLETNHYDIVHGFESRPTVIFPALSMQRQGIPLYLDWADWFGKGGSVEERPNPIMRTVLRPIETYFENNFRQSPCGTTVICSTLKQRAIDLGVKEKSLCLLPNGFDVQGWTPLSINKARQIYGLHEDALLVGYLGSLFPKDAILMTEAFSALVKREPRVKLLHIGNSNYRVKQNIKHTSSLIETGPVSFQLMMAYLSACEVLWLPLRNTPANQGRFPLKFTDYLSCGRPIIATDVGDVPIYIRKYNTGIVTEDTPESLSAVTVDLLHNQSLQESFAENALKLSQDPDHSWVSRADKLLSFYNQGH